MVIGACLFAADRVRDQLASDTQAASARRIELDATRIETLERGFVTQMGRAPNNEEAEGLLAREIDEEILYREALALGLLERDGGVQTRLIQKMLFLEGGSEIEDAGALLERAVELGLHQDDVVVRRILVQKMRLRGSALSEDEKPTQEEIAARYAEDANAYREPDRMDLLHVFLSSDRRAEIAASDAEELRAVIRERGLRDDEATRLGDPFPLGHRLRARSERDLERSFGGRFASDAFATAPGEWSLPTRSAYGWHLVFVVSLDPGQTTPLDAVARRIAHQIEQERRDEKFATLLSDLRTRYEIVLPEITGSKG
jgi:hypothetical protein